MQQKKMQLSSWIIKIKLRQCYWYFLLPISGDPGLFSHILPFKDVWSGTGVTQRRMGIQLNLFRKVDIMSTSFFPAALYIAFFRCKMSSWPQKEPSLYIFWLWLFIVGIGGNIKSTEGKHLQWHRHTTALMCGCACACVSARRRHNVLTSLWGAVVIIQTNGHLALHCG